MKQKKPFLTIAEMAIFAMLGTVMFCSKLIMDALPNIHLLGMFIVVYTIVFRKKALVPIYIFVMLTGLYGGFGTWWLPYLYIWTILWAVVMLLPKNMPKWLACIVFPVVCALHGLAYGTLYAPVQALLFGLNFEQMLAWIAVGFPWDITHSIGNFVAGLMIVPLAAALKRIAKRSHSASNAERE